MHRASHIARSRLWKPSNYSALFCKVEWTRRRGMNQEPMSTRIRPAPLLALSNVAKRQDGGLTNVGLGSWGRELRLKSTKKRVSFGLHRRGNHLRLTETLIKSTISSVQYACGNFSNFPGSAGSLNPWKYFLRKSFILSAVPLPSSTISALALRYSRKPCSSTSPSRKRR